MAQAKKGIKPGMYLVEDGVFKRGLTGFKLLKKKLKGRKRGTQENPTLNGGETFTIFG